MRKLILLAVLPMACIATTQTMARNLFPADSVKINHVHDGNISEWTPERFETDPKTKVQYAVDHDAGHLYIAMKIAERPMQMRVSMNGMKLFLNTRGKHREGTGIEFPVFRPNAARAPNGVETNEEESRKKIMFNMIVLKTFGFDDKEDKIQFVGEEGLVNIAYDFDAQNNLCIEYRIPMNYFGDAASLKNKTLAVGWKINEAMQGRGGGEMRGGAPGSSGGGGGRRGGGGGATVGGGTPDAAAAPAEPNGVFFWTNYHVNF